MQKKNQRKVISNSIAQIRVNLRNSYSLIGMYSLVFMGLCSLPFTLGAQTGEMSSWYGANGKKATFSKVVKACQEADVILFGELHNNAASHWYQLQIFRALYKQNPGKVKLGMEMLETHQQAAVDSFLRRQLKTDAFIKSQTFWPNHKTDYHPLLEDAQKESIPVIATNVPRKYARMVSKLGSSALDTLPIEEKKLFCPLPFPVDTSLNCYKNLLSMGHGDQFNGYYFASAQALKDATMAHFLLKRLEKGDKFLHLNGAYHSDNFESIGWYIRKERPDLRIVVISTIEKEKLSAPDSEERKKGNFILVTDPDSPKSY